MRKIIFLVLLCWFGIANASFFSNLFGGSHHKKSSRNQTSQQVIDPSQDNYQQFCTKNQTPYGFQIRCQLADLVTSFKPSESAVIKCSQTYRGISNKFPSNVALSNDFISSLNLCQGASYGPFTVPSISVLNESGIFVQKNSLVTYYDIACQGLSGYESNIYAHMAQQNESNLEQQINLCVAQAQQQPQMRNFVMMFYICAGIALISLIIVIIRKYKQRNH